VQTGKVPNCNNAQANNQTIVKTNFGTGSNEVCYPTSQSSCVWYDISVIPQNCTNNAWTADRCANTGGASYNLPVSLACTDQAAYTCMGPTSGAYGPANHPSKCGNPLATCYGNSPSCANAYFWPMFGITQPDTECLSGQTLTITLFVWAIERSERQRSG
jgi:hypothetical protein